MHQKSASLVRPASVAHSTLWVQSYRFAVVGALSTLVNYGVNQGVLAALGNPQLSSAVGYLAGVAAGFPLNRNWSFQSEQRPQGAATRYLLVYLATFFLNSVLAGWAHSLSLSMAASSVAGGLPMEYLYYLPVIAVTTIINFLGCKFLAFKA